LPKFKRNRQRGISWWNESCLAAGRKAKRDNRTSNVILDFVGSSSTCMEKKKEGEKGKGTKL